MPAESVCLRSVIAWDWQTPSHSGDRRLLLISIEEKINPADANTRTVGPLVSRCPSARHEPRTMSILHSETAIELQANSQYPLCRVCIISHATSSCPVFGRLALPPQTKNKEGVLQCVAADLGEESAPRDSSPLWPLSSPFRSPHPSGHGDGLGTVLPPGSPSDT